MMEKCAHTKGHFKTVSFPKTHIQIRMLLQQKAGYVPAFLFG
jgi:hypothetical protein